MSKLIIKNCFVKVKINLDIILSEKTFDNGVVKRWVAYFLKWFGLAVMGTLKTSNALQSSISNEM